MENNENMQNANTEENTVSEKNTGNDYKSTSDTSACGKTNKWVRVLVILFGISILASIIIMMRPSKIEVDRDGKTKVSGLASLLDLARTGPGIGWVEVRGIITESYASSPFDDRSTRVARKIRTLAKKDNVKSIVVEINSPGGTIGATQDIYDAIMYARKEKGKPVIALFKDVAASGGYYIACACDKIISLPGTLTGSIGVIFQTGDATKLLDKIGVKFLAIKSGEHKDIASVYRKMTDEERKMLQETVDDYYQQFLTVVAEGRSISKEKLKTIADGRIFSGRQAHKVKLVDELGGTREAIKMAKELGKIKGKDDPRIIKAKDGLQDIFSYINLEMKSRLSPTSQLTALVTPRFAYLWVY